MELVEQVISLQSKDAEDKKIKLVADFSELNEHYIVCDEQRIKQVLLAI